MQSAPVLAIVLLALLASGSTLDHDHGAHDHGAHDHGAQKDESQDEAVTSQPKQEIPEILCSSKEVCVNDLGPNADCFSGQCQCSNGSEFNADEGKCREPITSFASDRTCISDRDCYMAEAKCRNGRCQCETDFIESNDKTKCLPLAKEVGWGCEEDVQCTTKLNKTTVCRDFTCACKTGTVLNHLGACIESKGLDSYCSNDPMCTTPNSVCDQGICACKQGFVPAADNQRCLEVADGYKSRCEESIQCTQPFGDSALCQNRQCICKTGTHFSDMKCWQDRGLSDRCDRPDECYIAADGANQKLQCIAGSCTCKPEYKPDFSTKRCNGAATQILMPGLLAVLIAVMRFA